MNQDDHKMNSLIAKADNVNLKENEFWFSRANQNKLVFEIVKGRVIRGYDDVNDNIKIAIETVEKFFNEVIRPTMKR